MLRFTITVAGLVTLISTQSALAAVPTPLHGPAAFDPGTQVRVLSARSTLDTHVGIGLAKGSEWSRFAATVALQAPNADRLAPPEMRTAEQSKARYESPTAAEDGPKLHLALQFALTPTFFEVEIDDVRKLGFEGLAGASADLIVNYEDDDFPLRFSPELGIGIRAQIFEMLFMRVVIAAERDLTEVFSDLADATFILRGALEIGADLPEPQPAQSKVPATTQVRLSLAYERPLEESQSRPGSWFVAVGVAY